MTACNNPAFQFLYFSFEIYAQVLGSFYHFLLLQSILDVN